MDGRAKRKKKETFAFSSEHGYVKRLEIVKLKETAKYFRSG